MSADASRLRQQMQVWSSTVFDVAVDDTRAELRAFGPIDTGDTVTSDEVTDRVDAGGEQSCRLAFTTPQAGYQDDPVDEIRPVNGPFLVFEIDGVTIFAKVVHPTKKWKGWFSERVPELFPERLRDRAGSTAL